eukprot:TRINITY_DN3661_c0_g1_i5.p3 TRINITY_DN3661_c0_g1~~TRINITY_DN3661_c0_g1_i5.p3  ORF type:complete len:130 (+),score=6.28 TRINITY_DN3661_c0_g1_i5:221-610(+)
MIEALWPFLHKHFRLSEKAFDYTPSSYEPELTIRKQFTIISSSLVGLHHLLQRQIMHMPHTTDHQKDRITLDYRQAIIEKAQRDRRIRSTTLESIQDDKITTSQARLCEHALQVELPSDDFQPSVNWYI